MRDADDLLGALVEKVAKLEGRVADLSLLETPTGMAFGSGAANQVATWLDADTLQGASRLTFGSLLNVLRIGTGAGNAEFWGLGIQIAASGDSIVLAESSSTYTTGGTLGWVGNSQPFLYVPGTSFKIGFGTEAIPNVNFRSTGLDIFQPVVIDQSTAITNSAQPLLTLTHQTSGTPAAGFGIESLVKLESTTTLDRHAHAQVTSWVVATDASRTSRTIFYTYDTAAREAFRIQASGSAAMIGFLGAAAIVRPTVTGSRGGNAALASVLTALANLGLIVNSSSA